MSYEEVTEIFVRVNSLGAKLRSSDLALAQITSRWPNLLKELEAFQDECEQSWFTIELGHLVRAIVVFATQQCLFRTVAATSVDRLKNGWEQAKEGLRFAINFLRTNAGIEDKACCLHRCSSTCSQPSVGSRTISFPRRATFMLVAVVNKPQSMSPVQLEPQRGVLGYCLPQPQYCHANGAG